jgi:serine/threonine protein phosphatase 1
MIAVVGDIHGCYYTLKALIEKIKVKYPSVKIYCVGDLVDRGNFSYEVFEFVIAEGIKFTPGNHDYMFYYFVNQPTSELGRAWIYNGSETTVESYNKHLEAMPKHLDMIIKAPLFIDLEDCFISHAGISVYYKSKLPKKILENTDQLDKIMNSSLDSDHGILWTRDQLLNIGKLQVVGHTRQINVSFQEKNNVVYIDTSVYSGNKLSAVIIEKNTIVDILSVPTIEEDIK